METLVPAPPGTLFFLQKSERLQSTEAVAESTENQWHADRAASVLLNQDSVLAIKATNCETKFVRWLSETCSHC
jgi:hypothetical protein